MNIREAHADELEALGRLLVQVYSSLEGFPSPSDQPRYYDLLRNIGRLHGQPDTKLLVAIHDGALVGGVVYFSDMTRYGAGGSATRETNASAFRLLAVAPEARGLGVGRALAQRCIELASERGHARVLIHTTSAMKVAWGMYERLGFVRAHELDFEQEGLAVFGFSLDIRRTADGCA